MASFDFQMTNNTQEFKEALRAATPKILEEWGLHGEAMAKDEITKAVYDTPQSPSYQRTGNLRNSLTHTTDDDSAYIGTNVEYAPYVEFGTSRMKPRPYLKPAVENHKEDYRKIMESYLT